MAAERTGRSQRPGYRLNFPALMRQCEQNFLWLHPLVQLVQSSDESQLELTSCDGKVVMWLRILEESRYTMDVEIQGSAPHQNLPLPMLQARLYFDANLAEVTAMAPYRRVPARMTYPNRRMHQQDEKHQWNRFLGDWLKSLHSHGYLKETAIP